MDPSGWSYLWAVGFGALLLVRRRYPVSVVCVTATLVIGYHAAGNPPIGVSLPLAAAAFSAAECGRARASMLAGVIAFGDRVNSRRQLRRHALEIAVLQAERQAREEEERRLAERLDLARELHDSVGHALTVVTLHAQVAEEALGEDEATVHRSLQVITDTASATFQDVRRTVAGLRQGDRALLPWWGLDDLESALAAARLYRPDIVEAIRAGAVGYLLKNTPSEELRAAVTRAGRGEYLLSPEITARVMGMVATGQAAPSPDPRLASRSARELEVLVRVGHGDTNDEIAATLCLSPATARTYVSRILAKPGARDRPELVVIARRSGLVVP